MSSTAPAAPSCSLILAMLLGTSTWTAPLHELVPTTARQAGDHRSLEESSALQASIATDAATGTGMLFVTAPAGNYPIDVDLEGEVTFADGARSAVLTGDEAAWPIPLRLTAATGCAAVGLAAALPCSGEADGGVAIRLASGAAAVELG